MLGGVDEISEKASSLYLDENGRQNGGPPPGYEGEPPPAPPIHSRGVVATDITSRFRSAAQKLGTSQLIKDEHFTLFEAVSAIELMDPKMDTGYLAPGESMEDEYDVEKDLLPEEIMGIIDQLLCLEMAWHSGHPLSQTVFTSLYIDRLLSSSSVGLEAELEEEEVDSHKQVLRAYCIALIKTCSHVNIRVKSEHYYEEEDFVTHTYSRSLLEEVDDQIITNYLNKVLEWLSRSCSSDLSSDHKRALGNRLAFRLAFFKAVSVADDRTSTDLGSSWEWLLKFLEVLKSEAVPAKPVPDSFSIKVQRRLASTVPPRPVVSLALETAYIYVENLCRDGKVVAEVLDYHDSQSLLNYILIFSARKPQPSVYMRTLLQYYVYGDMMMFGSMSIRQVLDDDFATLVLAEDQLLDRNNDDVEVTHDPRYSMAIRMESFRQRAAMSYLDLIRTFCQNRCRTRRTLHHGIRDWDNLQFDAEDIDAELVEFTNEDQITDAQFSNQPMYSLPLSSWSFIYKLRQMEWFIQMGFELEVYQPAELAGMYWYLQHILSQRTHQLARIRMFTLERYGAKQERELKKSKKKSKAAPTMIFPSESISQSLKFLEFSMLEASATQNFADALSCLYAVLSRSSLIPASSCPYDNQVSSYELRMKAFLPIGLPALVSWPEFHVSSTRSYESSLDILNYAAEAAGRAKKDFEILSRMDAKTARCVGSEEAWKKNIKDYLKACIMTGIGIATVKKVVASGQGLVEKLKAEVPLPEKAYHCWWIVPKISAVQ